MENIADSKFFKGIDNLAAKMNNNKFLSAYSASASSTMGLIMVGAVFSIINTLCTTFGLYESYGTIYNYVDLGNSMTMGLLVLILVYNLGYNYAGNLGLNQTSNGVTALITFLIVAAPITTVTLADGSTFTGLSSTNLGASGMFVAMIVAFTTVKINEFCAKKNVVIKMPEVVPSALSAGFSATLPMLFSVVIWYGASLISNFCLNMDIPTLIMTILQYPLAGINSYPGVIVLVILQGCFWFVGIHGSGVLTPIVFPLIMTDVYTNMALISAGQDPVWTPMMAYQFASILGGNGNIWALEILGLRSKSEKVKAVSKAAVVPGAFSIGEPAIFGYPVMYNPTLALGFLTAMLVPVILASVLGELGILYPYITYIYAIVPFNLHNWFCTGFSIINLIFDICLIPICMLCYYPFYKVYEKRCIAEEMEAATEMENTGE